MGEVPVCRSLCGQDLETRLRCVRGIGIGTTDFRFLNGQRLVILASLCGVIEHKSRRLEWDNVQGIETTVTAPVDEACRRGNMMDDGESGPVNPGIAEDTRTPGFLQPLSHHTSIRMKLRLGSTTESGGQRKGPMVTETGQWRTRDPVAQTCSSSLHKQGFIMSSHQGKPPRSTRALSSLSCRSFLSELVISIVFAREWRAPVPPEVCG
ncbi:hypothetical protein ElyMa_006958300 [Elysia marginata]|uniref:Uncharacterized protein n=1 Tax=Elysia marginata TaxID=1093978 RepID=A0AAV4JJX5_9GAST|nr:hypothetical protein ElyMa_006958300 [Elysia marginata]